MKDTAPVSDAEAQVVAPQPVDREDLAYAIARSKGFGLGWADLEPMSKDAYLRVADDLLAYYDITEKPVEQLPGGQPRPKRRWWW